MNDLTFNVIIEEKGSLEEDLENYKQKELGPSVYKALNAVADDMKEILVRRIEIDVYKAYPKPKQYKRRSKDTTRGIPLIDVKNNVWPVNKGTTLVFDYAPTGEHVRGDWHTADADDLIGRIEKKDPPYFPRAQAKVPPRPFWHNFVDEILENGLAERLFVNAMKANGEEVIETGDLIREPNDGDY